MALPSSGEISFSEIQTEFGGTNPISVSEYYRGGSLVTNNNTDIPTSGTIDASDFYGGVKQFSYTFSSNTQEVDLNTTLTSAGWNGSDVVLVTINSGVYIWSDSTSTAALTISSALNGLLTITNNGYIIGKGGAGSFTAGAAGGAAIANSATGVTLTNASSAFIAGGGGGGGGGIQDNHGGAGGGGAGGGAGGGSNGGAGGSLGQAGGDSDVASYGGSAATGGGAGGGGGGGDYEGSNKFSQSGAGGGRILPGTGGSGGNTSGGYTGANGGSAGSAGSNASGLAAGGGGGGWGANGGNGTTYSGGAGGAAISGTAIATYTNNGTVYGSTA